MEVYYKTSTEPFPNIFTVPLPTILIFYKESDKMDARSRTIESHKIEKNNHDEELRKLSEESIDGGFVIFWYPFDHETILRYIKVSKIDDKN